MHLGNIHRCVTLIIREETENRYLQSRQEVVVTFLAAKYLTLSPVLTSC